MPSLFELIEDNRDDYTDKGWKKYLQKALTECQDANYFELFGLNFSDAVDSAAVNREFRKLALQLHTDKAVNKIYEEETKALFQLVLNAKESLLDPVKCRQHWEQHKAKMEPPQQSTPYTYSRPASQVGKNPSFQSTVYTSDDGATHISSVFSSGFTVFQHGMGSANKVYNEAIPKGHTIKATNSNIVINADVYGVIENQNGNIQVNGNVYGSVLSIHGNVQVTKNIMRSGSAHSDTGDVHINGSVYGTVSSEHGKVVVDHDLCGSASSSNGKGKISGNTNGSVKTGSGNIIGGIINGPVTFN